jgi:uncharacterized protein YdiU (UPF0061 family)
VAPSFIRFGNFEIHTARGDVELLRALADFTIARDFPHLASVADDVARREAWLAEVCERTARMLVHWMRVGFVHGVMNTDNMSILGLTIDYGPYGWLDDFDPTWTPNTTDAGGRRYRYGAQPAVAQWNVVRLAEALAPLFGDDVAPLQRAIDRYADVYGAEYGAMLAAKLGLEPGEETLALAQEAFMLLHRAEVDFTRFFRALGGIAGHRADDVASDATGAALVDALGDVFYDEGKRAAQAEALGAWLARWRERVRARGLDPAAVRASMHAANPRYVLRNYLAQEAIDAAEGGDPSLVHELLEVMRRPYDDQPGRERFAARRPEWARHRAGCSMLSCSS